MNSLSGTLKFLSEIYPGESQLENQGLQGLKRDLMCGKSLGSENFILLAV